MTAPTPAAVEGARLLADVLLTHAHLQNEQGPVSWIAAALADPRLRAAPEAVERAKWHEITLGDGLMLVSDVTRDGVRGIALIPKEYHPVGQRVEGYAGTEIDPERSDVTVIWFKSPESCAAMHAVASDVLAQFQPAPRAPAADVPAMPEAAPLATVAWYDGHDDLSWTEPGEPGQAALVFREVAEARIAAAEAKVAALEARIAILGESAIEAAAKGKVG